MTAPGLRSPPTSRIAAGAMVDVTVIGEPLDLLGKWDVARLCVVADATRSGATAGTVQLVDLGESGDADSGAMSTHGMDLPRVLRLARAIGRAPQRLVVVGIEGESFTDGCELSAIVTAAVAEAGELVLQLVDGAVSCV